MRYAIAFVLGIFAVPVQAQVQIRDADTIVVSGTPPCA